jgi:Fe-S cluster assembly iron-binding protein IscA
LPRWLSIAVPPGQGDGGRRPENTPRAPGLRQPGIATTVADSDGQPILRKGSTTVLMLTPTAIDVVRNITTTQGAPEEAGLRIASAPDPQQEGALQISITAGPAEQDQVLSGEGSRIFLDQQAAAYLDDKILDAGVDADGKATFVLAQQDQDTTAG